MSNFFFNKLLTYSNCLLDFLGSMEVETEACLAYIKIKSFKKKCKRINYKY